MRVLHVYRTWFPDSQGGGQEAIRQIVLATRPFGVESRVFTLSPDPVPARIDRPDAVVVRERSWAAPASCDLGGPAAFRTFRREVREADVVQYHFPWPFADLLHLCAGTKRPSVMTWHSDIVRQRLLSILYRPLARRTLDAMDAIATTSPAYAAGSPWLARLRDPSRLRMIPLGIVEESYADALAEAQTIDTYALKDNWGQTPIFEKSGSDPNYPDSPFLAIGVLRYYKGFDVLVEAAARSGLPVWIAGDGPLRASLQEQICASGAPVRLLGHVSDAEKMALLRACRALVLPSPLRSEAFGMVLVEASMMSRPMISCEIGTGTSFVNLHGETGLVVAPGDAEALAGAMQALADDPLASERFGAAARRRYEQHFAGPALGRAWARLYEEVFAEETPGA